jgi:DNA-binding transcriptional LysR family regulator
MELRHLRYFVAVAEHGGFTRAAERLGIQQPPLSQQVKALELELGFKLLNRHPRGVDLTAGGAVFLEEARRILGGVNEAVRKATRVAQGMEGSLSVGFTISAAVHHLSSEILREFRKLHPGVALEYREGNAAELTEKVATGSLQAALIRAPVAKTPELVFVTLLQEDMLLALPNTHPLARRGSRPVPLLSLAGESFILVRRPGAPGMYANLIAACHRLGFSPLIAAEVQNMLTNLMLVAAGVGISVVPASVGNVHQKDVVYRAMGEAPGVAAPLTLVYRADGQNPATKPFLKIAKRLAGRPL